MVMTIGIIAEGKGDCAVLHNILIGELGISTLPLFLRPEFSLDETDLSKLKGAYREMSPREFSSWSLVKKDCLPPIVEKQEEKISIDDSLPTNEVIETEKAEIDTHEETKESGEFILEDKIEECESPEINDPILTFFNRPFDEECLLIIQLDSAECEDINYEVKRPPKGDDYCLLLRKAIIDKIHEWFGGRVDDYLEQIRYAICIEETEAWVYTLYTNRNTSTITKAKEAFEREMKALQQKSKKGKSRKTKKNNKENQSSSKKESEYDKMLRLSIDFQKLKNKKVRSCLERNESLKAFVESLTLA